MANNRVRVGDVEIMMLSDGVLEFDLCNFFPTVPEADWRPHEAHVTDAHTVRFNLGSYLIRADGRTILVDTGLGPRPEQTPDVPWGLLLRDFQAHGVRLDEVDMVVMTHLHRDHVGWNLTDDGGRWVPTFPRARYWVSTQDWEACHRSDLQPTRFPNAPTCVWPLAELGLVEFMQGEQALTRALTAVPTPGHTPGHIASSSPRAVSRRSSSATPRIVPCRSRSPTGFPAPTWIPISRAARAAPSWSGSSASRSSWPPDTSRRPASGGSCGSTAGATGAVSSRPV